MPTMQLRKAERQKAKLRIGLSGPSGSGKTYSALLIAKGIVKGNMNKVAVIDTENGSADLYADMGDFNVIRLEAPYSPERYVEAIKACEDAGMEVLIIDSTSHEWDGKGGCLESNELLGQTKFKGNNWAAWSQTTPRHQKFIEAITTCKIHVITTARSKTDTIQTEDKKIKKVGLKEIQRDGFEYELTLNFTIDRDGHFAVVSKDRTAIYDKVDPFLITEAVGTTLIAWAESGKEPIVTHEEVIKKLKQEVVNLVKEIDPSAVLKTAADYTNKVKELCGMDLIDGNLEAIVAKLQSLRIKETATTADTLAQFEERTAGATPTGTEPADKDRAALDQETQQAEKELDEKLGTTPKDELLDKKPTSNAGKGMMEGLKKDDSSPF